MFMMIYTFLYIKFKLLNQVRVIRKFSLFSKKVKKKKREEK